MDKNTMYNVTNRSASVAVYSVEDLGVRRSFQPGETKKIPFEELEKLSFKPGGAALIAHYFLIKDEKPLAELGIATEPEYQMTEKEIIDLMKNGSLDAWLDCLDFAPAGVIELVKSLSVSVPLNDYEKREALREKTGFDVDTALKNLRLEKEEEEAEKKSAAAAPKQRRTQTTSTEEPKTARRTTPTYKVVSQD